jgi:hypothetical protein
MLVFKMLTRPPLIRSILWIYSPYIRLYLASCSCCPIPGSVTSRFVASDAGKTSPRP